MEKSADRVSMRLSKQQFREALAKAFIAGYESPIDFLQQELEKIAQEYDVPVKKSDGQLKRKSPKFSDLKEIKCQLPTVKTVGLE